MSQAVLERAWKSLGIRRAELAINTSHTHSGPVTGSLLRLVYSLSSQQEDVVSRYSAELLEQCLDVIKSAVRNIAPADLAFGHGLAGFAVNRRRVKLRYLPGPVDHDVPVLTVRQTDGKLLAIVFGYACHATVLNEYQINGDWPGYAQKSLEELHPGAIAMFVAGCGADLNPLPRRSVELAQVYGKILATAVSKVLSQRMRPVGGQLNTAFETVCLPFSKAPSKEELLTFLEGSLAMQRYSRHLLNVLEQEGTLPSHYPFPVQVWQFGRDLKIIFLAGEVVVDYSLRLKAKFEFDNTWVAGYSNDVFAYIPSLRVLREGGYESGGSMIYYGHPSPFSTSVEEIIVDKVTELVQRTTIAGQH